MADKDREPGATGGDIDFSDGELQEMGVELAGRDSSAPQPRRSRSMLRVPVDEVPRPQANDPRAATTTEPSLPVLRDDPADEVVEHAFANGGIAEGVVPSELRLAATPAKDEMDAFTAKLIAERERVIEMEIDAAAEEVDTDPKALAEERTRAAAAAAAAVLGAIPQPLEDSPTRAQDISRMPKPSPPRGVSPALAALARAVAVPNEKAPPPASSSDWLAPAQVSGAPGPATADAIWSSAPAPEPARVAAVAAAIQPALEIEADSEGDDELDQAMELDDGELEDVEPVAPLPKLSERQRTLTPVVPPPPMPAPHPPGNGHAPEAAAELAANGAMQAGAALGHAASPQQAPPTPPTPSAGQPVAPMPQSASSAHAIPPPSPPVASPPSSPPPSPPSTPPSHPSGTFAQVPAAAGASTPHALPPPTPASAPPASAPPQSAAPPPSPASAPGAPPAMPSAPSQAPGAAPPVAAPSGTSAQQSDQPLRPRRKRRAKQWFEEIFDDDYLRTLPFLTPRQTEREAQFVGEALQIPAGGALLDLACGYGRHAMELAAKSYKVTGLDLSLPLLIRAADAARRVGVNVNFIHGDMREMTFENEFDGAYCMFTSFGYFDDDTNRKVAANLARAIKPGGKLLIEVVNRDYVVRDLPTRVWWQGDGCVVLEEVDFNYFSSRVQVQRSIIFEDGRQVEQEISIRAYSLHEIGKVLHHSGFRVTEVSGGLSLRGKFFGANSRQLIVVAEKKLTP